MLNLWVVYERPLDHPEHFVVRRWVLDRPTKDFRLGRSLREVREFIPPGLHRVPRHPNDDAKIVETWI